MSLAALPRPAAASSLEPTKRVMVSTQVDRGHSFTFAGRQKEKGARAHPTKFRLKKRGKVATAAHAHKCKTKEGAAINKKHKRSHNNATPATVADTTPATVADTTRMQTPARQTHGTPLPPAKVLCTTWPRRTKCALRTTVQHPNKATKPPLPRGWHPAQRVGDG